MPTRVDRPRASPVARIGEAPAHLHDASLARLGIPHDDRQQVGDSIGGDVIVAAFAAAAIRTALHERFGEGDDLGPRDHGREFPAHGETLTRLDVGAQSVPGPCVEPLN